MKHHPTFIALSDPIVRDVSSTESYGDIDSKVIVELAISPRGESTFIILEQLLTTILDLSRPKLETKIAFLNTIRRI
jgi:hypothetical protein